MKYPGRDPGRPKVSSGDGKLTVENGVIRCSWSLAEGCLADLCVENRESGQTILAPTGALPRVVFPHGGALTLVEEAPAVSFRYESDTVGAEAVDSESGLQVEWSAALKEEFNAVVQSVQLTATTDVELGSIVFLDANIEGARQVGEVDGSVVVCGDLFLAVEHPLAKNTVDKAGHVRCELPLASRMRAGESRTYTFAVGAVPPGQLRRGFLYYIERRRIHPYRQFLHYNNWYDVVLARPTERMTEQEALDAIEYYGRELVEKRGVKVDAVVWDDGWDDFNTLWDFHRGFSDGFRNLMSAAEKYGMAQGVWMSPNGGYATAKEKRITYGKPLGYETNERGYAMGGPNYRKAFQDACLKMIRENGVVFFKFDGMGEGGNGAGTTNGTTGALSNDIHAILELSRDLHKEKPDVYISATSGTWASPFWLLYADSIWRQGMDSGHHGAGDSRQQWITYRDMFCYERVVQAGPLCPINSLMLHGILIGNRPGRAPAGMALDEKSVADEAWSFFASGTCLQELYVSPDVPTDAMLDQLAAAAMWARKNEDTLIDTHWVGGNPRKGEVYGRAAWQPGKGILSLRNPSEGPQSFAFTLKDVLELPGTVSTPMKTQAVFPRSRALPDAPLDVQREVRLELGPFETVVMEFEPANC